MSNIITALSPTADSSSDVEAASNQKLTFSFDANNSSVFQVAGMVTRVLHEVHKLIHNSDGTLKAGYVDLVPATTFSSCGGAIISYICEACDWQAEDHYDADGSIKQGLISLLKNGKLTSDICGSWALSQLAIPIIGRILGYIVSLFKGFTYNRGTAISNLVDNTPYPFFNLKDGTTSTTEHITAITRLTDHATITVTSMDKYNPNSIFYQHNHGPTTSSDLINQLSNYVAYPVTPPPVDSDQATLQRYLAYRIKHSKFILEATCGVSSCMPPIKPSSDIQSLHSGIVPDIASEHLSPNQVRDQALSDDYYDGTAASTQSVYSSLTEITQKIFRSFCFGTHNYEAEQVIVDALSENERYHLQPTIDFQVVNGNVVTDTTLNGVNFQQLANLLKITPDANGFNLGTDCFVIFFRVCGNKIVNILGDSQKNIEASFFEGYNNFTVEIFRRGSQKIPS